VSYPCKVAINATAWATGRPGRELGQGFSPGAFRAAWTVQIPIWVIGVAGVLRTRPLARRQLAADQTIS